MGSLERASLYERLGMGYALRAKRSGRGVASSISSGEYASSGNWRRFFDDEGVRMRFLSMLFFGRDALLLGEGMNMFWSFAAISPSTTRRIFFCGRGRGLLRLSGCRRLQARKGEGYGRVPAPGSSSRIQASTEMGCIEGGEKWRGTGWFESMLLWWSGLRLTWRGNHRLVVALCQAPTRRPCKLSAKNIPS
jgi:hypothetical protein